MDCDVMGCAFAFIKDLEDIQPRFNLGVIKVNTFDDNIDIYLELDNFNMTIMEILNRINELVNYHYGLVVSLSNDHRHMHILFDYYYIYSLIGIYDDEDSAQYDHVIYNEHKKAMRSIHENDKPLDFPNSN